MPLVAPCLSTSPTPVFTNKPTATLQQSATHGDMFPGLCRSSLIVLGHHVQMGKQSPFCTSHWRSGGKARSSFWSPPCLLCHTSFLSPTSKATCFLKYPARDCARVMPNASNFARNDNLASKECRIILLSSISSCGAAFLAPACVVQDELFLAHRLAVDNLLDI